MNLNIDYIFSGTDRRLHVWDLSKIGKSAECPYSVLYLPVFRIRIDPSFLPDPDPEFKNPDPSVFLLKQT